MPPDPSYYKQAGNSSWKRDLFDLSNPISSATIANVFNDQKLLFSPTGKTYFIRDKSFTFLVGVGASHFPKKPLSEKSFSHAMWTNMIKHHRPEVHSLL
jgi:hypothetical protein